MVMPRHPEQDDDAPDGTGPRWRPVIVIVVVVLVLIVVIALHLTGVLGPKAHGG